MYVATIGFFDGVHRGHRCLLAQLRDKAQEMGLRSMVVSFRNHPREVVQRGYVPQLLTLAPEKERLLAESGVDEVLMLDFTPQMAQLSSQEFMQLLRERYGVEVLLMGYDHRFGHDGGTIEEYTERGAAVGIRVLRAKELEEEKVSSRLIRQLLEQGDAAQAAALLARPYSVEAQVEHGHAVGHQLGFPTANLSWPHPKLMPHGGVYAAQATLPDGRSWPAMLNIGQRPTIDDEPRISVEVHLLGFEGNLYGQTIQVAFIARLRDEQRFASREALMTQLQADAAQARRILEQTTNHTN